jgi:hypothetical protein
MPQTPTPATPKAPQSALHIFKAGRHTAMSGQSLQFSESALRATVAAYNPALHEAPLVVGHPTTDLPAYGWVKSLAFSDGLSSDDDAGSAGSGLYAQPGQVNPDFADMVAAGSFKKISASFYSPDSPNNPAPGVYYLRHVGFLGAQAPAIKGLGDVPDMRLRNFAAAEEGVVTFSEWDDVTNASLWRSLREWLIGDKGQAVADAVIPGYQVSQLEQAAQDELREAAAEAAPSTTPAAFTEAPPPSQPTPPQPLPETLVTPEEAAALTAQNTQLANDLAAERAATSAAKAEKMHLAHAAFCEDLSSQGRLLPAFAAVAVATLDHFGAAAELVEFGEGDAKAPLIDSLKGLLAAMPVQVSFGESATNAQAAGAVGNAAPGTVSFAVPSGYKVDPVALGLHLKAASHQATHGGTFVDAVRAVSV